MAGRSKYLMVLVAACLLAACGRPVPPGEVTDVALPAELISSRQAAQIQAGQDLGAGDGQILFGDLHVHTAFSPDAFITSVPLMGGQGLQPPADACDFARYCSALDFWAITDHAEGVTPRRWRDTRSMVQACNAVSGPSDNPDLISFLGYEWSQVATTPDEHYGHKNVIFRDYGDDNTPARSVAAPREQMGKAPMGRVAQLSLMLMDMEHRDFYLSINEFYKEIDETPLCPKGVNSRDLPADCLEVADDPGELFSKLDDWGYDALVIPHGNAWGMNTPPGTTWNKQLSNQYHDPDKQKLIEVYSGHGNSEEYRDYRAVDFDEQGNASCPPEQDGFLPCCVRAGQIIRDRCDRAGLGEAECAKREMVAQQNYIDAGISGHLTVPGAQVTDWLNCGQCTDCFNPAFKQRPGTTTQYAMALNKPENDEGKQRFRFGFIGSSDNHRSRPGTGYKEFARQDMTEANGPQNEKLAARGPTDRREPVPESLALGPDVKVGLNTKRNMERQASFFMTGGLVAVHAPSRDRDAVYDALDARQVYATSGDRTLLWFDLVNDPDKIKPMGSEVVMDSAPRFRVRAAGAFKQKPGCPDYADAVLGPERLESLCRGECYNPSDERKRITRIEIVRITPRENANESVSSLIEDPWRSFDCDGQSNGCVVEFEDPEFESLGRDALYYARAIQEPSPAVNAGGLRCEYDANGQCIKVNPCYGDYRTPADDACLSDNEERAWSSPIFVDYGKPN